MFSRKTRDRIRLLIALSLSFGTLPLIFPSPAMASPVYSFTTAGATGSTGPTQAQVNTAYTATTLAGAVTINTRGIQEWAVPFGGRFRIEAYGSSRRNNANGVTNGTANGFGSFQSGEFTLTSGQVLKILVGQTASTDVDGNGGTFVATSTNTPLIVAGGAGGDGPYATSWRGFQGSTSTGDGSGGAGQTYGAGGGGFTTNGGNGTTEATSGAGKSFINGGEGGPGRGGFGGGGQGSSTGGGGGGYSGGAGGSTGSGSASGWGPGQGGLSYNSGSNKSSGIRNTFGAGYVTITALGPAVSSFAPTTTLTSSNSILYNLVFSQSITSASLVSTDFTKSGTGSASCSIGTPSGSGASYQVQLTGCSSGTVILTLQQGSITNASSQTGPSSPETAATVTIDTASPTISSVTAPASMTYGPNTNIDFTVNFSESVTVSTASGRPRLAITVGSTQRYADFSSLTDSRTATFRYTVQSSALDIDRNGIDISTTFDLNNGTISDLAGNALSPLTFAAPTLTGVKVAQLPGAPTITSIDPSNQTLTINFTPPSDSGSDISNYQYSTNGGSSFSPFSPADTTTPLVLSSLSNGTSYNVGIRGLTTLNGSDTFGATSNFIRETPTVVTISAPSFTVARGTLPGSFKLNFSPVTGATSYTVKVYKSNDSFASPFVTITNYTSGTDIQDGDPRTCGNSSTPICYGVAVGHTFKFTITPVAGAGYTSAGEGEKSGKYGMFYPYGAGTTAPTDGVVGLDVIDLYSNKNLGKSGIVAYIYSSANNYASVYETASIVGTSWNRIALPSGDSYSVTLRHLGATVGDTIWLDSDESTKPSGMFVWNKPNAPSSITAERNGSGSIRISWTRASGPYQTYYYATSTNGSAWTSRGNTTSDSATISSLTNGTPVYVRVHVFGSGTYQRASDYTVMSGTITPAGPPGPVATGSSSPGDASIVLGWTAPSDNGGTSITGYLIEYSPSTATYTESITALSTDTRLTLSGLVNGTSYFVRIKAVNSVGPGDAVEFAGGSPILVKGTAGSTVGAVTAITRTTATISATINARGNTTTPTLTWGLVGGSQTDVTLASVSSDNVVVTSNLTGLLPGRRYQVTSEVDPGISQDVGGRPVYFTTTPDSVTGVAYTTTTSSVTVSWNYDSGGNGYGFSYDATASLNGNPVGSGCTNITAASGGRSSCQFTGLTANTAYTFAVTKSITGGDYGNGTSEAYTLVAATDPNVATISLSINGGNTNLQFGSTINIVATTNVAGKVTFRLNGRSIKSCVQKNTISLQTTCAWKPTIRGTAQVTAFFDPTSNLYTNVTTNPTPILVARRSGTR